MKRKYISWKTKCAAAVLHAMAVQERFGLYPQRWYDDAKKMTEDQFLSLFQWDHYPHLHESEHPDRDQFWNLAPMLIRDHSLKTKADAKVIAKGRRIRRKERGIVELNREMREFARTNPDRAVAEAFMQGTYAGKQEADQLWAKEANRPGGALSWRKPKLQSRGFDKTKRKKMDGTVVKR
jgi:hypothetical protein